MGLDLREAGSRVHVMSEGSAVCWMRFKIVPDPEWKGGVHGEGKGGWEWENCYFYRRTWNEEDGWKEGWEGMNADAEMEGLVKYMPDFFD